jgi:hypothetical protein
MREPDSMRPGGSTRRSSDSAVTDLPQPDSPTIPTVSPARMSNETPSTARAKGAAEMEIRAQVVHAQQRLAGSWPARHGHGS